MTYTETVYVDAELTDLAIVGWPCRWCGQCIICAETEGWECVEGQKHEAAASSESPREQ